VIIFLLNLKQPRHPAGEQVQYAKLQELKTIKRQRNPYSKFDAGIQSSLSSFFKTTIEHPAFNCEEKFSKQKGMTKN